MPKKHTLKIVQASFNILWVLLAYKLSILKEISIWRFELSSRQRQDNKVEEVAVCCSPRIFRSRFLSKSEVFKEELPKTN